MQPGVNNRSIINPTRNVVRTEIFGGQAKIWGKWLRDGSDFQNKNKQKVLREWKAEFASNWQWTSQKKGLHGMKS